MRDLANTNDTTCSLVLRLALEIKCPIKMLRRSISDAIKFTALKALEPDLARGAKSHTDLAVKV